MMDFARNGFLSRTTLSGKQDGGRRSGNAIDEIEDFLDGRTLAQDPDFVFGVIRHAVALSGGGSMAFGRWINRPAGSGDTDHRSGVRCGLWLLKRVL